MKTYQNYNGTSYDQRTPVEVIRILEHARLNRDRLHVSLGFTEGPNIGQDWLEENDVYGFIGRSTGSIKIPLLIHNRRSLGGLSLLDHCIVRIRTSTGNRILYQHPDYHHGHLELRNKSEPLVLEDGRILTVDVLRDGKIHASFETMNKARRFISKLGVRAAIAA